MFGTPYKHGLFRILPLEWIDIYVILLIYVFFESFGLGYTDQLINVLQETMDKTVLVDELQEVLQKLQLQM